MLVGPGGRDAVENASVCSQGALVRAHGRKLGNDWI